MQVRVSLTQRHRLIVLATPFSTAQSGTGHREGPPHSGADDSRDYSERGGGRWARRVSYSLKSFLQEFFLGNDKEHVGNFMRDGRVSVNNTVLVHLLGGWYIRTAFWAAGRIILEPSSSREFHYFLRKVLRIFSTQGTKGLICQLKAGLYLLNSAAGGEPVTNPWFTGVPVGLSKGGMPRFLHPSVRTAIRGGDSRVVRLWASMLNTYKVFELPGHAKFETIILGPSRSSPFVLKVFSHFVRSFFWPQVLPLLKGKKPYSSREECKKSLVSKDIFSCAAGPNHPVAGLGAEHDAASWGVDQQLREDPSSMRDPEQCNLYWYTQRCLPSQLAGIVNDLQFLSQIGRAVHPTYFRLRTPQEKILEPVAGDSRWGAWLSYSHRPLKALPFGLKMGTVGKISPIFEAAGKVRLVAITDHWTQRICAPFHSWIEGILRALPSDCTFDQEGGLKRYIKKCLLTQYSFDLSAATDRIPRSLYTTLFGGCTLLPDGYSDTWMQLLSDRVFDTARVLHGDLAHFDRCHPDLPPSRFIRYGTGQPMGALSSWPSMALLHHAIVQLAHYLSVLPGGRTLDELEKEIGSLRSRSPIYLFSERFTLFEDYALLGDDIVIGDKATAEMYLSIMEAMGVSISLSKSYLSLKGLVNFANRTFVQLVDISPISIKEELMINSLYARFSFAYRMVSRGYLGKLHCNLRAPYRLVEELCKTASLPTLMRSMCPSPMLWMRDWGPMISQGKVRADLIVSLALWCYPSEHVSTLIGLPLRSYRPLAKVLLTQKGIWTSGQEIRSDSLPKSLVHDEQFMAVVSAMIGSLTGSHKRQATSAYCLMKGFKVIKVWERLSMFDEMGVPISNSKWKKLTGDSMGAWASKRKNWTQFVMSLPVYLRDRFDAYWTPYLGKVLTSLMRQRSIYWALLSAIHERDALKEKEIRTGLPVYIGEEMYSLLDRKTGDIVESTFTLCLEELSLPVSSPDFGFNSGATDAFKTWLRQQRDNNLSLFRLLAGLKTSLEKVDLPIHGLDDFK